MGRGAVDAVQLETESLTGIPAVYADEGARHERALVRQQETHDPSDFFRSAEPLNRLGFLQHLVNIGDGNAAGRVEALNSRSEHGGVDGAGTDTIDAHIEPGIVDGRALGQLADGRLGHPVDRTAALAHVGLIGAHEYDRAGLLLAHDGQDFLKQIKCALQVDRQHALEFIQGRLLDGGEEMDPRRHEQAMDGPPFPPPA